MERWLFASRGRQKREIEREREYEFEAYGEKNVIHENVNGSRIRLLYIVP